MGVEITLFRSTNAQRFQSWCLQGQPSEPDPEQTSAFGNTVEPRKWPGWAQCGRNSRKRTGSTSAVSIQETSAAIRQITSPRIRQDYECGRPLELDSLLLVPLAFARAAELIRPSSTPLLHSPPVWTETRSSGSGVEKEGLPALDVDTLARTALGSLSGPMPSHLSWGQGFHRGGAA